MKRWFFLLSLFGGFSVMAQSTNVPSTSTAPVRVSGTFQAQTPGITQPSITLNQIRPNEVVKGRVTYSGSAVEAVKKRRILPLFNPRAPASYGGPEENLARDPINGRIEGLKIFAIRF